MSSVSSCPRVLVSSQPLDVSVFLPQDGNLVPEQHGVQPHLGVHQGHEAQPVAEGVHAGLPLGEVVGVGPARRLGALRLEEKHTGGGEEVSERGREQSTELKPAGSDTQSLFLDVSRQ